MPASIEADSGQPRDRFSPVLLGLLITLILAGLLVSDVIPHDSNFWLWLDRTPR